ncbi:MAG: phosphoribosylglycinamide formyltransferase [Thiocapsa sp.]|uniref:phosphoribosylglycinamide formyltransferase n=1 Tax=Thiocapsa sp. TaxID=2024551 RepID=UPI001BD176C3|nr:phosphoribosylglycinamide formyltransferase [Thiocapsa sp.]QVL49591.1 MAG: phosphoribosylglycinamide formyltransferase [Thiocapsa sp.]
MPDGGRLRVVALISGSGSNLQALMDDATKGRDFEIVAVVSNRADAFGLERARRAGIPAEVLDHRDFAGREPYEAELRALIDRYAPGLVILAGFMRILTPAFVEHYSGRMLNIHPSLLPKFRGLQTHQRALDAEEREHGASVHFVTPELDGGPVVIQARLDIHPGEDAARLAQRVLTQEHIIYPRAVGWFAQGCLRLGEDGRPWLDGEPLMSPIMIDTATGSDGFGTGDESPQVRAARTR